MLQHKYTQLVEYFSLVFVIAKVEMKRKIGLVFYPFDICILLFFVLLILEWLYSMF
jgi:hypothetical protein